MVCTMSSICLPLLSFFHPWPLCFSPPPPPPLSFSLCLPSFILLPIDSHRWTKTSMSSRSSCSFVAKESPWCKLRQVAPSLAPFLFLTLIQLSSILAYAHCNRRNFDTRKKFLLYCSRTFIRYTFSYSEVGAITSYSIVGHRLVSKAQNSWQF